MLYAVALKKKNKKRPTELSPVSPARAHVKVVGCTLNGIRKNMEEREFVEQISFKSGVKG